MAQPFVIVGAGLAGAKAAESLREQGSDRPIVLIGEETHRPYERPPLSKDYLAGRADRDSVFVHPRDWYADHDVELRLGVSVDAIQPDTHQLRLGDGATLGYDKLLLATGASPRTLPDLPDALLLRRLDDADRLRKVLADQARLVIIGGGWIGLETAAAARQAGLQVTVLETAALPLLPVLGHRMAEVFAGLHRTHGVDLRCSTTIEQVLTGDGRTGVRLTDGSHLDADAVLVAVGASPNVRLAEQARLEVDNGIVVDAALRTSDPDIVAAGDVANAWHPLLHRRLRVEHWANALNQATTAAATMLGRPAQYTELPYFYTDQYDLGMEYLGHAEPGEYDRVVVRGDTATGQFLTFWLRDSRVLAGMNANIWDVGDHIKALITSGKPVDADRLADPAVPLESLY